MVRFHVCSNFNKNKQKTRQELLSFNLAQAQKKTCHFVLIVKKKPAFKDNHIKPRSAVVHFNFRARSTFPVPVCTVPLGHWVNKADNQQD